MSLLEALAEAVVNVSASKGGGALTKGGAGADSLFGQKPAQSGGGLEDLLGAVLGGSSGGGSGRPTDGLGGLLEQLTGGQGGAGGGLDDILGQLTGAAAAGGGQGGGLGGLLGAVAGALQQGTAPSGGGGGGSFGGMLNQAISNRGTGNRIPTPSAGQEAAAGLMLRAMIQAAKSDGKFDQDEQSKLLSKLGDVSAAEKEFVNAELAKPVNAAELAREVPKQLAPQVYAMSVLAIDLDNQQEAQYLHQLAQAFGLDQNMVNHVHAKVGAPALYR